MSSLNFTKIFHLMALIKGIYMPDEKRSKAYNIGKAILAFLLGPIYALVTFMIAAMYFIEELLCIPTRLIDSLRTANTPYDKENKTTYTASYIILYICLCLFDAFAVVFSWFISVFSLVLDLLGGIICLGCRPMQAYPLSFAKTANNKGGKYCFWISLLAFAAGGALFVIFNQTELARLISTSYETVFNGIEEVKIEHLNADLFTFLTYLFYAISYAVTATILFVTMRKKEKGGVAEAVATAEVAAEEKTEE